MLPIIENFSADDCSKFYSEPSEAGLKTVLDIRTRVMREKDAALIYFAHQFDQVRASDFSLKVTQKDIKDAYHQVPKSFIKALKEAKKNIEHYHRAQLPKSWTKKTQRGSYGMRYTPIDKAGLYVPGGRALYPSTVLMNAIPATLAGVETIVITTPPRPDGSIGPQILVAADLCGVENIIKVGGAQAIFALAYGTETVPAVDKIVGPGNIYVTLAKQHVYGVVDIDKPAGPSEVLVLVEDPAYAGFAAAELLAQLEHDPLASAVAISTSRTTLEAIQKELALQFELCLRKDIIRQAMEQDHSKLLLTQNMQQSIQYANFIASEHLVLLTDNAEELLPQIKHAGSIFLGPYTPVALGDYFAGPNHVLPTGRATRYASPLGVMDFMKYSATLHYTKESLAKAEPSIKALTEMEGLDAHYSSVKIRGLST